MATKKNMLQMAQKAILYRCVILFDQSFETMAPFAVLSLQKGRWSVYVMLKKNATFYLFRSTVAINQIYSLVCDTQIKTGIVFAKDYDKALHVVASSALPEK